MTFFNIDLKIVLCLTWGNLGPKTMCSKKFKIAQFDLKKAPSVEGRQISTLKGTLPLFLNVL